MRAQVALTCAVCQSLAIAKAFGTFCPLLPCRRHSPRGLMNAKRLQLQGPQNVASAWPSRARESEEDAMAIEFAGDCAVCVSLTVKRNPPDFLSEAARPPGSTPARPGPGLPGQSYAHQHGGCTLWPSLALLPPAVVFKRRNSRHEAIVPLACLRWPIPLSNLLALRRLPQVLAELALTTANRPFI
ncbi:hypothetical protein L227DRAFT_183893 [Lentinus tigrinus ALCF2SS1-6]|uniref:Uncharacterized protein n=1 Tax=Lentinus tigrinus ALCF2SS1-6 TaxID=1328759 RepID=A0A5C2S4V7_9APHY|nr:hypothetical protein L227DRAFT_183893 [Lentinus tigrinus ALCF2SS1-6]